MPDVQKIEENKVITLATMPEIAKLIHALISTTPVDITNQEIDKAMMGIESGYKVAIESLPDEDYEYKQKQEENIKQICYYLGEFYKQANTHQQDKIQKAIRQNNYKMAK